MNRLENWFCATPFWQRVTQKHLIPRLVAGSCLGDRVLELGAGPGAATEELRRRADRVTSLEYDHQFAIGLARRKNEAGDVVQGDAAMLPFADATFSSAIAVLMLHHLKSAELQDKTFTEIFRILRPGGVFLAFEIQDGWFQRIIHIKSTFVPLPSHSIAARLANVGFSEIRMNSRHGGVRLQAVRPL